jgi:hypothetical protein
VRNDPRAGSHKGERGARARPKPDHSSTRGDEEINVRDWDQVENWAARSPADEVNDDERGRSRMQRVMRSPLAMTLTGGALLAALAWGLPSDPPHLTPRPTRPVTSSHTATATATARAGEAEFNLTKPVNRQFVVEVTSSGKVFYTEVDLASGSETILAQGTTNGASGAAQATARGVVMGLLPQDAYGVQPLLTPGKRGATKWFVETTPVGATTYQAYIATFAHPTDAARFHGLLWTGKGETLHGPSGPVPTVDFPSTTAPLSGRARVWAAPEYGAVGLDLDGALYAPEITAREGFFAHTQTITTASGTTVTMIYGLIPQDGTVTKVGLSDGRDVIVTGTSPPGTGLTAFYGEVLTTKSTEATVREVTWRDKAGREHHRGVATTAQ